MIEETLSENVDNKPKDELKEDEYKLDSISALQDTIDGFFLSLFNALRSTRSAVTPEGQNTDGTVATKFPEYEEFIFALQNDEESATSLLVQNSGNDSVVDIPRNREEYTKLLEQVEKNRDEDLVSRLAQNVLDKSAEVDERISKLPGIERNKKQQMERIEVLLKENAEAEAELQAAHEEAEERLEKVRTLLQEVTCSVLGIEQEL